MKAGTASTSATTGAIMQKYMVTSKILNEIMFGTAARDSNSDQSGSRLQDILIDKAYVFDQVYRHRFILKCFLTLCGRYSISKMFQIMAADVFQINCNSCRTFFGDSVIHKCQDFAVVPHNFLQVKYYQCLKLMLFFVIKILSVTMFRSFGSNSQFTCRKGNSGSDR
jgi:hypothetical protein